jgi:hypothetical protein
LNIHFSSLFDLGRFLLFSGLTFLAARLAGTGRVAYTFTKHRSRQEPRRFSFCASHAQANESTSRVCLPWLQDAFHSAIGDEPGCGHCHVDAERKPGHDG